MLAYPDQAAIEAAMKKMGADPQIEEIGKELEKEAGGPPIAENGIVAVPMTPTDYSPMK